MTEDERTTVQSCIDSVVNRFLQSPNVFLTEEDVRFHLCRELLIHFNEELPTEDNDRSIELHSEVRWYGDGNLKLRSDIVLIDVSTIKVRKYLRMPSKGYAFNIPKGIIEIKFRRPNGISNNRWREDIAGDIRKLEGLQPVFSEAGAPTQTAYWVVALDKKSRIEPPTSPAGVRLTYEYSNRSAQEAPQPTVDNTTV